MANARMWRPLLPLLSAGVVLKYSCPFFAMLWRGALYREGVKSRS